MVECSSNALDIPSVSVKVHLQLTFPIKSLKLQMDFLASHLQFKIRVKDNVILKISGFNVMNLPSRDQVKSLVQRYNVDKYYPTKKEALN